MNVPLLDLKAQYATIKGEIDAAVAGVFLIPEPWNCLLRRLALPQYNSPYGTFVFSIQGGSMEPDDQPTLFDAPANDDAAEPAPAAVSLPKSSPVQRVHAPGKPQAARARPSDDGVLVIDESSEDLSSLMKEIEHRKPR